MNTLTIDQALEILEQVRLAFNDRGANHDKIRQALETIKAELSKKQPKT